MAPVPAGPAEQDAEDQTLGDQPTSSTDMPPQRMRDSAPRRRLVRGIERAAAMQGGSGDP
jgi:hypothetical protein